MWAYLCGVLMLVVVGVSAVDKSVTVGDITTKVKGQSGKIAVYKDSNETNGVTITYDAIEEIDSDGDKIQKHSYNNFAQLTFTFSDPENNTYGDSNVTVTQFNFTSTISLDGSTATLTSYVYIFTSDGNITVDGADLEVKEGDMKFNAKIENWPFCATCSHGNKDLTGQFLDFSVEIKGKKAPDTTANGAQGKYDLGGGATVVIPKEVIYDNTTNENMPAGYPKLETKGSKTVFIFRFKKFSTSALYDPMVSLGSDTDTDTDGGETATEKEISASGISTKVLGQSGKIELMATGSAGDSAKNRITVQFDNLQEMTSGGTAVKDNGHKFNTFANQDFTFSAVVDEQYPGTSIGVQRITFQSTLTNGAVLKVHMYAFKADGEITQENETTPVKAGNVKFNVEITNWSFCSNTVACQQSEVGEYLDFEIVMKGSKGAKKETSESGEGDKYDLGSGSVMLSRKIKVDGAADLVDMMSGYPMLDSQGSKDIFRFRFPKFTSVMYDPSLSLLQDDGTNGSSAVKAAISTLLVAVMCLVLQRL